MRWTPFRILILAFCVLIVSFWLATGIDAPPKPTWDGKAWHCPAPYQLTAGDPSKYGDDFVACSE